MAAGKINNWFTHSFIVGNGVELKRYNDDDERCGTRKQEREIRAVVVNQARGRRGKRSGNPIGNWGWSANKRRARSCIFWVQGRLGNLGSTKAQHHEWATTFGSCPSLPLVRLNTFSLYCSHMNKISFKPKYMHMTLNRNELGKRCLTLIKFLQSAKTEHGTKAIPIYIIRRVLTKATQLLCPTHSIS